MRNMQVPDYEGALASVLSERGEKTLTLHATRLHTGFDFAARFIADFDSSKKIIEMAKGVVVQRYHDGSAWVLFNKLYGQDHSKIIVKLKGKYPEFGMRLEHNLQLPRALFEKIKLAKGDYSQTRFKSDLNESQLERLAGLEVRILREYVGTFLLAYKSDDSDAVTKILRQK